MNELPSPIEDKALPSGVPNEPQLAAPALKPALPSGMRKPTKEELADIVENRTYAIVSYFYILSLVILATKYKSKFALFHAKQGTVLFILSVAFLCTPPPIMVGMELVVFFCMLVGIFQASFGFFYKIPIIYDLTISKLPASDIPSGRVDIKDFFKDVWAKFKKARTERPVPSKVEGSAVSSATSLGKAREKEMGRL